jgi:hypothetical protein
MMTVYCFNPLHWVLYTHGMDNDSRPGIEPRYSRKDLRVAEEMTIYTEDGSMLGTLECQRAVLPAVKGLPPLGTTSLTISVVREDLIRWRPTSEQ